jgi:hypothetical protein
MQLRPSVYREMYRMEAKIDKVMEVSYKNMCHISKLLKSDVVYFQNKRILRNPYLCQPEKY